MRILFVCTGNTCRSPMAEALMKREAARRGITGHEIQSAGLHITEGDRASKNAVEAMAARGIDIDRRLARQVSAQTVHDADLVLTMTGNHARILREELPQYAARILTLGEFAGVDCDVEDPYSGGTAEYEHTARQLEELVGLALDRLQ